MFFFTNYEEYLNPKHDFFRLHHKGSPTDRIIFQLNPDQIADPEVSRNLLPHTCEAYVGYPAGDITIEILKSGEQEFRKLDVIIESTVDNRTSCEIHRKIVFRIVFTSDMEKAIIRCTVINKHFPDSPAFYSKNETVRLIPGKYHLFIVVNMDFS